MRGLRLGLGLSSGVPLMRQSSGDGSLADVIASAVFDLDATQSASYSGSGTTWSNLVTAPADGSAQTAYDFYTGDGSTSTTYPTFNGTPGSAAAYWSFDGGDNFRLKSGINTAFINALHKTTGGTNWWVVVTYRSADLGTRALWNTQTGTTAVGCRLDLSSAESLTLAQRGVGSVASTGSTLTPPTDYVIIFSYTTSGTLRRWINTTTAAEEAIAFSATSTDATSPMVIASRLASTSGFLGAGDRIYSVAMGNEYLDNTKAAAIIAALEARHARDYTV